MKEPAVAVLGGGNGAFAHASHLALLGHRVNLFELPEFEQNIASVRALGGIELVPHGLDRLPKGFARLNLVSTDPREALEGAEVVWVVVPAFAQTRFAEACAPYFHRDHIVVLTPGNGGSLEFVAVCDSLNGSELPTVAETDSMFYACKRTDSTQVTISGYKEGLGVAALPGTKAPEILPKLKQYYPELVGLNSIIETQLGNVNLVVHAPIFLLNAGYAESKQGFDFYHQGCTPSVGRIVEAVDRERMAVGQAAGLSLIAMCDWQIQVYGHQGAQGDTLTEVLATNPAYRGHRAPQSVQHRFLLEDIPYGMVTVEKFGVLVGVPTPITSAIITIASGLLGVDLRQKGWDWRRIGIDNLSIDEIKAFVGHR